MPKPVRRARPDSRDQRGLLERILDTPQLAHAVPRLPPEVLHRVIQSCGLEDCGDLVALATPAQLVRVFDLDLWRSSRPGLDEHLDPDRFGLWLEVLMESGAAAAAQKLSGVDADLVIAALAQHVVVFDGAAASPFTTLDGDVVDPARRRSDGPDCEIGGYLVEARRTASWDAIVALLLSLDAEHPDYFHRVMRGCRSLSNASFEVDGLDDLLSDSEQDMFDLALDREQRREKRGYVAPAQARAFLQMSRQVPLGQDAPPRNPVAGAYLQEIDRSPQPDAPDAIAALVDLLVDAGVLTPQPRALLEGAQGDAPRLARIRSRMRFLLEGAPDVYSVRTEEFGYLANALMAGCSIQARPFTAREASDAAVAVCNLGLENWPLHWRDGAALPEAFLVDQDLVTVFQVGWTVLHDNVCMYAAERLLSVVAGLTSHDREIQSGLDALRVDLGRHWQAGAPWRARDALDVITALDMPAWAALLGLIDECPVMHAGIGASRGSRTLSVSASAFEFIAENSQIASVHAFMEWLPETLRG